MAFKDKEKAIKYNNEFNKNAYDRINLTVPKGKKDVIRDFADKQGKSVNSFVNEAIDEKISRESQ